MAKISISDTFDGGRISYIGQEENGNRVVLLRLQHDVYTELEKKAHMQYFAFRSTVSNLNGEMNVVYNIENAKEASYAEAWSGSTVFYTKTVTDSNSWRRVLDTVYDKHTGQLTWSFNHDRNGSVYFSYFPPFTYEQHLSLVDRCAAVAKVESLGRTHDGREMECVQCGTGDKVCWIIHRQHPGETMAEYFAEGLLTRLLGLDSDGVVDGMARRVLGMYRFFIVPCMCPDGAVRGHLRTNSVGANLNREWADHGEYKAPTKERSPEVYSVLKKMDETGVDMFLDIHGDEEIPYNFLCGAENTKHWGPRLMNLHGAFLAAFCRANSDMQQPVGYPAPTDDRPAPRNIATSAIANRFNCLAATLEMPFKDCLSNPDQERGWSPQRSRTLGASVLDPLAYIHPHLRDEDSWNHFPPQDEYVRPNY